MAQKKTKKKKKIQKRAIKKLLKKFTRESFLEAPHMKQPSLDKDFIHRAKILVVGLGGGGGSIVSEIASRIPRASFVVANTDARALKETNRNIKKFQFGVSLTNGLGTGMNAELGELAAQNDKEKIKKLLEGYDLCIFVACLGGGTASGAMSVFARISRSLGNLSYGILTLPFSFEGERKMEIAAKALENIRTHLNAYTIIPNERIFQILDKSTPLSSALSEINRSLAKNLQGLIEMIFLPGIINIDFADIRTILEGRGRLAYLISQEINLAQGKPEEINNLLSKPLYPYNIKGARGILYNIAGDKNLQLSEVSQISSAILQGANSSAKIIFGIRQNLRGRSKTEVTLLAVGCSMKPILSVSGELASAVSFRSTGKSDKEEGAVPKKLKIKAKRIEKKSNNQARSNVVGESQKPPENSGSARVEVTVRRNALELKKAAEEEEKKILEEEQIWESPAIFRKKQKI